MQTLHLEQKYIHLLSPYLLKFKQKKQNLYNFRCPICGDSQKNDYKARAYFYQSKWSMRFTCHNCQSSMSFRDFLRNHNNALFRQFQLDIFREHQVLEGLTNLPEIKVEPVEPKFKINLPSVTTLDKQHFVRQYLINRKIPLEVQQDIYYANDFAAFVAEQFPEDDHEFGNEPRLIFPFRNRDKSLAGLTARSFRDDASTKYIIVKAYEGSVKMFGLDKLDFNKRIYIVEGPIDSFFLDNCAAMMDGALTKCHEILGGNKTITIVHDNQPRNKEIVREVRRSIKAGFDVFIWPDDIAAKDLNELICAGYNKSEVQALIDANTYNGLKADLLFGRWQKI
jgi:hypothetical protein